MVRKMYIGIYLCVVVGWYTVIVVLGVGVGWSFRVIWLVLKSGHTGHITDHTLFFILLYICAFEVLLEGVDL